MLEFTEIKSVHNLACQRLEYPMFLPVRILQLFKFYWFEIDKILFLNSYEMVRVLIDVFVMLTDFPPPLS